MKTKIFKVTIEITGLGGTQTRTVDIKAANEKSARKKAYAIIGDRTGHIVSVN